MLFLTCLLFPEDNWMLLFSCWVQLCNPMDCSPPGSFDYRIPRQEYWSGLLFPPPGDLPDSVPVILTSPASADGFFTTVLPGKPYWYHTVLQNLHFFWIHFCHSFILAHNDLSHYKMSRSALSSLVATSGLWLFKLIKIKIWVFQLH